MALIDEILNGIYGKMKNPVIVYDLSGGVLWSSTAADRLAGENPDAFGFVFAEIAVCSEESGKLSFGFGGSFHRAEIDGIECWIAELSGSNALLELFGNPQIIRFVQQNEMMARRSISEISLSGEMMCSLAVQISESDAELCRSNIYKCCCRIMKGVSINSLLAEAAGNSGLNNKLIYLDAFLGNFASGCEKALGEEFSASYRGGSGCIIRADETLLTYFMLSLLRELLDKKKTGVVSLEISASENSGRAGITLSVKGDGHEKKEKSCGFDSGSDEINCILAEKLSAEYSFSEDVLNISLKCAENNGEAIVESDKIFYNDSPYSPYNIMLGDLIDYGGIC